MGRYSRASGEVGEPVVKMREKSARWRQLREVRITVEALRKGFDVPTVR